MLKREIKQPDFKKNCILSFNLMPSCTSTPTKVLLIGDSASSSLGSVLDSYPDLFPSQTSYARPLEIHNASAVGMTLADANIHIQHFCKTEYYEAVILALGNCDASAFGYLKPRTLFWRNGEKAKKINDQYSLKTPLRLRNKPFQYERKPLVKTLERCISPNDFSFFLKKIVDFLTKQKIHLVVMVPLANNRFPPCNNLGNFLFFKIFGCLDDLPLHGDHLHPELLEALLAHQKNDIKTALQIYQKLYKASDDIELRLISANNSAAILFDQCDFDQALAVIDNTLETKTLYEPILLFNKAVALKKLGRDSEASDLFDSAYGQDLGTFRIHPSYQNLLRDTKKMKSEYVHYLDWSTFLDATHFIDYCHPNKDGHQKIFTELESILNNILNLEPGSICPSLKYINLNPDRYVGFQEDLFEYFNITVSPNSNFCEDILKRSKTELYSEILKASIKPNYQSRLRTQLAILIHPLFGSPSLLEASQPKTRVDQGRIPEFFFLRHMLPLYKKWWQNNHTSEKLSDFQTLIPIPEKIDRWWNDLKIDHFTLREEDLAVIAKSVNFAEVLERAKQLLLFHLKKKNNMFSRYRAFGYFFMKESFIFGTASHWNILCHRFDLLFLIDTCLFGLNFIDAEKRFFQQFQKLLHQTEITYEIHKKFLKGKTKLPFFEKEGNHMEYIENLHAITDSVLQI